VSKVWVLDTETKGTGAEMVPLEKIERDPASPGGRIIVPRERTKKPVEPRGPKVPPRFKVVDVMTRQVLAEDADTRATVELLKGIRSVVDVSVYAWDETNERWQALGLGDRKKLFALAHPSSSATSASTR
jgi:hypothetical protein